MGNLNLRANIALVLIFAFFINTIGPVGTVYAQDYTLPAPGAMVHLSPEFNPPILKGIKVHPDNPFRFDFILDRGDGQLSNDALKDESSKLIKYFLASLTIPEKDLWVNLSPYEKDRIIPNSFGLTEMGRDLLVEDYMLKQITASLIYPEDEVGKRFWKRIYEVAAKRYGTTNIPVDTFNKVWIVPEKAVVYENAKAGTAYVVESKLKVMLEQDYLSLAKHEGIQFAPQIKETNQLGSQIVREIVIPELTKEVNKNENFAHLRQVYNSLILATWYKKKIKDSILEQVYADKNKVAGVNIEDPQEKERIYQRYIQAFKKGVYNYIKEDVDPATQETVPRKYFSGGAELIDVSAALAVSNFPEKFQERGDFALVSSEVSRVSPVAQSIEAMAGIIWWRRIIASIRSSSHASLEKGGVVMDRRAFMKMLGGAAASAGVDISGMDALVNSLPGSTVIVPRSTYVDLFLANFSEDNHEKMTGIWGNVYMLDRWGHLVVENGGHIDPYDLLFLGKFFEYSQENQFFAGLPDIEQLQLLRDFFDGNIHGANFGRFAANPGVREMALGNVQSKVWDEYAWSIMPKKTKDQMVESEIESMFLEKEKGNEEEGDRGIQYWLKNISDIKRLLPNLSRILDKDPRMSGLGSVIQRLLNEGPSGMLKEPFFRIYMETYYKPLMAGSSTSVGNDGGVTNGGHDRRERLKAEWEKQMDILQSTLGKESTEYLAALADWENEGGNPGAGDRAMNQPLMEGPLSKEFGRLSNDYAEFYENLVKGKDLRKSRELLTNDIMEIFNYSRPGTRTQWVNELVEYIYQVLLKETQPHLKIRLNHQPKIVQVLLEELQQLAYQNGFIFMPIADGPTLTGRVQVAFVNFVGPFISVAHAKINSATGQEIFVLGLENKVRALNKARIIFDFPLDKKYSISVLSYESDQTSPFNVADHDQHYHEQEENHEFAHMSMSIKGQNERSSVPKQFQITYPSQNLGLVQVNGLTGVERMRDFLRNYMGMSEETLAEFSNTEIQYRLWEFAAVAIALNLTRQEEMSSFEVFYQNTFNLISTDPATGLARFYWIASLGREIQEESQGKYSLESFDQDLMELGKTFSKQKKPNLTEFNQAIAHMLSFTTPQRLWEINNDIFFNHFGRSIDSILTRTDSKQALEELQLAVHQQAWGSKVNFLDNKAMTADDIRQEILNITPDDIYEYTLMQTPDFVKKQMEEIKAAAAGSHLTVIGWHNTNNQNMNKILQEGFRGRYPDGVTFYSILNFKEPIMYNSNSEILISLARAIIDGDDIFGSSFSLQTHGAIIFPLSEVQSRRNGMLNDHPRWWVKGLLSPHANDKLKSEDFIGLDLSVNPDELKKTVDEYLHKYGSQKDLERPLEMLFLRSYWLEKLRSALSQALPSLSSTNLSSNGKSDEATNTPKEARAGDGDVMNKREDHSFSSPIQVIEVAVQNNKNLTGLEQWLQSNGLLKMVRLNSAMFDNDEEQRFLYIGGHLDACINNSLQASVQAAHLFKKKLEIMLPLDQIYISREDFNGNSDEATRLKRQYAENLIQSMERYIGQTANWAVYWDQKEVLGENRDITSGAATIIVRFFTNSIKMRSHIDKAIVTQGAMASSKFKQNTGSKPNEGGIDLTPANNVLQTQNAGEAIKFHLNPAQLAQLQNAPGFVPVIINIRPMRDLRVFLDVPSEVNVT